MNQKKLNLLRDQIDGIDKKILNLVETRSNLANEVIKAKDGKGIFKPKREESLIRNLFSISKKCRHEFIESIWRLLISENLSLQGGLKLALGPSKSIIKTTIWHFGKGASHEVFDTDEEALRSLASGKFDASILPISNNFEVFITKNKFKIEKVTESPISDSHELEKVAIYKLHDGI